MISVEELLQQLVERGGSDLHITAGAPPKIRIDGKLISTEHNVLDPETSRSFDDNRRFIDAVTWLTEADRTKIFEGTARKVYPRLGARLSQS